MEQQPKPESVADILRRLRENLSKARQDTQSQEEKSSCLDCADTGWVKVGETNSVRQCKCQLKRIAATRLREMLEGWPEFRDARLEAMEGRSPQQMAAIGRVRNAPLGSYYFHGIYRGGKTHLMIAQYRLAALGGIPCLLRSSRQLADEMRKAEMSPPAGQEPFESPVIRMLSSPKHCHLFIDDIEKTPARTDFRAEVAFHWLDLVKRHQHGLTLTSNLPLQSLTSLIGDAAVARIDQVCELVEV
jgi:DNA replication protein DnaC